MSKIADIDFLHLCEYATLDINQKVSIMGIFHNFNFEKLPSTYLHFVISLSIRILKIDNKLHKIKIRIIDSDGTNFHEQEFKFNANKKGRALFLDNVVNTTFKTAGRHTVEAFVDDEAVGNTDFTVNENRSTK